MQFTYQALKVMDKYGAKSICEQIRWHINIENREHTFRINNTYTAYYARLAMDVDKKLENFFEVRRRK